MKTEASSHVRSLTALAVFCAACSAQTGISTFSAGKEPACDAPRRGNLIVVLGDTGKPDLLEICLRDGAGRYAWSLAGRQNPATFANSRLIGGCPMFPDDNVWNSRADSLPVDAGSAAIIRTYAANRLGSDPSMHLNLADSKTPAFPVAFESTENDGGAYPIAPNMQVEGYGLNASFPVSGGPYKNDAHLLVLRTDQCKLYEIFSLNSAGPPYRAGSGAIYDTMANDLRPDGWTSADAAGLPIWPGVLRYEELFGEGEIQHVLRFTVNKTRNTYIWPARHYASHDANPAVPPMGSRWRLKASFDEGTCRADEHAGQPFPPELRRLIRALKRYGMMLSDNGSPILMTADADPRWGDPNSPTSRTWGFNSWTHCIRGSDFEVVNAAAVMINANSAAFAQ